MHSFFNSEKAAAQNKLNNRMFWLVDSDIEGLKVGAQILLKIHERLLVVNEDADITGES